MDSTTMDAPAAPATRPTSIRLTLAERCRLAAEAEQHGHSGLAAYIRALIGLPALPCQSRAVAEANRRRARR